MDFTKKHTQKKNTYYDFVDPIFEAFSENAKIFWLVLSDGLYVNIHCYDWITVLCNKLLFGLMELNASVARFDHALCESVGEATESGFDILWWRWCLTYL